MEQSPWEADNRSSGQEILPAVVKPKGSLRVQRGPPLDSILSQLDLVHSVVVFV
jgi:hypothetical protein